MQHIVNFKTDVNNLKHEVYLNNTIKFSSFLSENTLPTSPLQRPTILCCFLRGRNRIFKYGHYLNGVPPNLKKYPNPPPPMLISKF
jgi:hypothetical protein